MHIHLCAHFDYFLCISFVYSSQQCFHCVNVTLLFFFLRLSTCITRVHSREGVSNLQCLGVFWKCLFFCILSHWIVSLFLNIFNPSDENILSWFICIFVLFCFYFLTAKYCNANILGKKKKNRLYEASWFDPFALNPLWQLP